MATILKAGLRKVAAEAIFNSIVTKTSRYYYYLGQTSAFPSGNETPSSSRAYEGEIRNNIFALKEVLSSDVSFVVERRDYEAGTTYPSFDSDDETGFVPYVYNISNFSVYICTKAGEGNSTEAPVHLSVGPVEYSDGYTWKYIMTIPLAQRDKFLTPDWIPISNTLNESFFTNGGIDKVVILDTGEGYEQGSTSLAVIGDGNAGSGASLRPIITDGRITSVVIDSPGEGYLAPKITVMSPTATRTAILTPVYANSDVRSSQALIQSLTTPGTVESVKIMNGGTGYTSSVSITLRGDGDGATIDFVRNGATGEIEEITVTNPGKGYTVAELVVEDLDLIGGAGFEGHVNLSPILGFGRDAVQDLNTSSLMIYTNLSRERLNGMAIDNTIRQFGLIVNPKTVESATYPRERVSLGNYMTKIPLSLTSQLTIGDTIYNEFPTTANSAEFIVEEVVTSNTEAAIRVRALNGREFTSGTRYFKNASVTFVADFNLINFELDTQLVSSCYVLETQAPALFDINTFYQGLSVTNAGHEFVIVATSTTKILVNAVDGGTLVTGDTLTDSDSNVLSPQSITGPVFDRKTGEIISVDNREPFSQSQTQSVSFRTIIKF